MLLNQYIKSKKKRGIIIPTLLQNCYPGNNLFYPFILYPIVILIRCHKTMAQTRLSVYNFMTLVYLKSRKTEK